MLRRIFLFLLVFGAGVSLLLFVTGNPKLFQLEKKEVKETHVSGGDSGLKVKMSDGEGTSSMGQNVGVVARGRGSLVDYAAENSKNEFRLAWEDSEPRSDGTYDLVRATYILFLREKAKGSNLRGQPKIQGKADRLNIKMQLGEGGKQSIDRQKEIHAFGFVLNAEGGGKDREFSLGLTTGELKGRIRPQGLSARTPSPKEKVEIRLVTQGKHFRIKGKGLRMEVGQVGDSSQKADGSPKEENGMESKGLDLTIFEDIEIFDSATKGESPFLTAKGPLRIHRRDEDRIFLEVNNRVRLRSPKGQKGVLGVQGIEGEGDRFTGLLSRGFIPGVSAQEVSFAWTEFRFHGSMKEQARLHVSGQELRGDHLGVALSSSGGVLELVAEGKPFLRFSDEKGKEIGVIHGARSIHWSRPGSRLLELFPRIKPVFGMGMDTLVDDLVVFEGKTVFEPTQESEIQRVVSKMGLRLFFRQSFGRPTLFFVTAPGEVTALGGNGKEKTRATVKQGVSVEPVGLGFAAGLGRQGGEFVVDREGFHLEGKGWLFSHAQATKERWGRSLSKGDLRFSSALHEDLKAWVKLDSGKASVQGIREADLRTVSKGSPKLFFQGTDLRFDLGEFHAEAEELRLLPDGQVLLDGGSKIALVSHRDPSGRIQKTQGERILFHPIRMLEEWRIPVLVKGMARSQVIVQEKGLLLSLKSDEQRFFPPFLPSFLQRNLARISLGSAGFFLSDWLYGVARIEVKGHVTLDFKKKGEGEDWNLHCRAAQGVSALDASYLVLEGRGPKSFKARLEQRKKGRLIFEGASAKFLSMGRDVIFSGSFPTPPTLKWEGERDGLAVVAKKGKVFFHRELSGDGTLRIPGPVTLWRLPRQEEGFQLSCSRGVFVELENPTSLETERFSRWKVPLNLSRIEARGDVLARGNGIVAQGDRLIYDTKTQWVSLEAKPKESVVFQAGPGLIWRSSPHLSVSLRSFEIRGGYGSLQGAPMVGSLSEIHR